MTDSTVRVFMVGKKASFYRTLMESAQNSEPRVELVGFEPTVSDLSRHEIDVVLIDATDEESVLDHLSELFRQKVEAKIILIGPHDDAAWIERVLDLGVDYCLVRPFDQMTLLRRLVQLAMPAAQRNGALLRQHQRWNMEHDIVELLGEIGVPTHYKGFAYLKTAIALAVEDESLLSQLTSRLYPLVARGHKVSAIHVERSIRHAIEVTWIRGNMQRIHSLFAYSIDHEKGKPTNGLFIARMSDYLRLRFHNLPSA